MSELAPPPWWLLLGEVRLPFELARLRLALARLRAAAPRGDGAPVMVIPGIGTDDRWTRSLRGFLGAIGWDAHGWGLGKNRGDVEALVPRVVAGVTALAARTGRPVRLVGWSLGGVLAREAARQRPDLVDRVVTVGTPVVGGPRYTFTAGRYRRRGFDLDAIEARIERLEATPIRVPIVAIYSRGDGVVAWRACVDRSSPEVEHVRVRSSHLGMIVHPEVYREIAASLARPAAAGVQSAETG